MSDGEPLTVRGAGLRNGTKIATGRELRADELSDALRDQRSRVTEALESFAENTMRYLREEGRLLSEGIGFPALETRFRDRHALVVVRGPGHKRDLRMVSRTSATSAWCSWPSTAVRTHSSRPGTSPT